MLRDQPQYATDMANIMATRSFYENRTERLFQAGYNTDLWKSGYQRGIIRHL